MKIVFAPDAWNDFTYWLSKDKSKVARINKLIKAASRTPHEGIGKPEPLKDALQGCWSRRIDKEHRLVYRITGKGPEQALEIIRLRYHYGK